MGVQDKNATCPRPSSLDKKQKKMIISNKKARIKALTQTIEDYKTMNINPEVINKLEEELIYLKNCKNSFVVKLETKQNDKN